MSTYCVINISTLIVENVILWDGTVESGWAPDEGYEAIESDVAQIGWTYADGVFTAPPPPPVIPPTAIETLAANTGVRDDLLAIATLAIAPLQDAVDLDDATDAETALLKKWKQYRVAVNRIDLTLITPAWPIAPT